MQAQRNALYGTQVGRHVLPGIAVAAGCAPHEYTLLIVKADRQAVELGFGQVFDVPFLQALAHALVERHHLFRGKSVVEREHGAAVSNLLELGQGRAADTLGW